MWAEGIFINSHASSKIGICLDSLSLAFQCQRVTVTGTPLELCVEKAGTALWPRFLDDLMKLRASVCPKLYVKEKPISFEPLQFRITLLQQLSFLNLANIIDMPHDKTETKKSIVTFSRSHHLYIRHPQLNKQPNIWQGNFPRKIQNSLTWV